MATQKIYILSYIRDIYIYIYIYIYIHIIYNIYIIISLIYNNLIYYNHYLLKIFELAAEFPVNLTNSNRFTLHSLTLIKS